MRSVRTLVAVFCVAGLLLAPSASARCTLRPDLLVRTGTGSVIHALDVKGCGSRTVAYAADRALDVPLGNGFLTDPSWLPGGRSFVYGWTHGAAFIADSTEIRKGFVRGGASMTLLKLPLAGIITEVAASPDGRRIAFTLYTPNYPVAYATWTPVGSPVRIYVVNTDGTGLQPVSTVSVTWDSNAVWSPDSRKLAFISGRGQTSVYVTDLKPGPGLVGTRVSPLDVWAVAPTWAPDGRHLAFEGWTIAPDPWTLLGNERSVWTVAPDGKGARRIGEGQTPSYAPDGRHLVVSTRSGLAVLDVVRRRSRSLTDHESDGYPVWSPDGRLIAFHRWGDPTIDGDGITRFGPDATWTIRPDGRGAVSRGLEDYGIPAWRR
ncbi:MAG: hypothetical protein M3P04_10580 [Actinomycetota bacterium]|nr:hypothetical protein [Actinomycetota bacterium]